MTAHIKMLENVFERTSRMINNTFPRLSVMWVVHGPEGREAALNNVRHKFTIHPGGQAMLEHIKKSPPNRRFVGMSCNRDQGMLRMFKNSEALALYFVNAEHILNEEFARFQAYMDVYQVLDLLNPQDTLDRSMDIPVEAFIPAPVNETPAAFAADYLARDAFAVIMRYFEGVKTAPRYLSKLRAQNIVTKTPDAFPEHYAFPVIEQAISLLINEYAESTNIQKSGLNPVFPAFALTREFMSTFKITNTKSWQLFAQKAQMMTWADHDEETTLGAAVYYTEDPFIRADAQHACELLTIKPKLMTRFEYYNPFADDELNERYHEKLSKEYYEMLILKAQTQNNERVFAERVREQNEGFLTGRIMGWCASSIVKALEPLKTSQTMDAIRASYHIFKKAQENTKLSTLKNACEFLHHHRRTHGDLSYEQAHAILADYEDFSLIREALEFTMNAPPPRKSKRGK
jgi:hypothetical protein